MVKSKTELIENDICKTETEDLFFRLGFYGSQFSMAKSDKERKALTEMIEDVLMKIAKMRLGENNDTRIK